jgi:hypothetical protein
MILEVLALKPIHYQLTKMVAVDVLTANVQERGGCSTEGDKHPIHTTSV